MKWNHFLIALLFLITSCAKRGALTGGPKDEEAPILVSAKPDYMSTNFEESKIKITFNEYIKLKDLNSQLIISPPMKTPPEISPAGGASKFIQIKILDTLQENTTYSFNFGNSVVDNSEGNIYGNFKYVFSTGDYIDSLKISGSVKYAKKYGMAKETSVLLYPMDSAFNDSTIFRSKGYYVGNTLDSTLFNIENIKEGQYHLIALKDKSNDFIYNPREDEIGFFSDTIKLPGDSIPYKLVLFKEELDFQVMRPKELNKGQILFPYEGRLREDLKITLSPNQKDFPYVITKVPEADSLNFWYPNSIKDSIEFLVQYGQRIDTFSTLLRTKKYDSLKINAATKGYLNLKKDFEISINQPITILDSSKISLMRPDSSRIQPRLNYISDEMLLKVDISPQESSKYVLNIFPGAISTFNEVNKDSLIFRINTKKIADYGDITFTFDSEEKENIIIEILDENESLIETQFASSEEIVKFDLLEPKKYIVRATLDRNNNKRWDTGDYLVRRQAEKVIYFPKIVTIRANFSENEVFKLIP